jgi:hypothetical protein
MKGTVATPKGSTIILPLKFGEPYSSDVRWPVISFSGHLFFYPKMDPRHHAAEDILSAASLPSGHEIKRKGPPHNYSVPLIDLISDYAS